MLDALPKSLSSLKLLVMPSISAYGAFWTGSPTLEPVSEVEILLTLASAKIEGITAEEYLHAAATGESRPSLAAPPNP